MNCQFICDCCHLCQALTALRPEGRQRCQQLNLNLRATICTIKGKLTARLLTVVIGQTQVCMDYTHTDTWGKLTLLPVGDDDDDDM